MIRNAKQELRSLRKELFHVASKYEKTKDDNIYNYMLVLEARYRHIKEGAKGNGSR